jgi:competence protein ComEC
LEKTLEAVRFFELYEKIKKENNFFDYDDVLENLVKIVEPYLSFASDRFQIKKILSETLATQIFVLPYLLYQIGRLSVIAPISNLVILPFIPAIMLLCFVVGIIAFIPFISLPLAGLLTIFAWLVIKFTHLFASIPFASFDISISLFTMVFLYGAYFAIGIFLNKKANATRVAKAL